MCQEADFTYDVLREHERRARKDYVCCACQEVIRKGDVYQYTFAFARYYSDTPAQYKHCLRCAKMLEEILAASEPGTAIAWELNCGQAWEDAIGELPEHIAELAFLTPDEMQARRRQTKKETATNEHREAQG